jgi:hypothetical protein
MAKPQCKLNSAPPEGFSILYRVHEALSAAGFDEQAEEFLNRAVACESYDKLIELAVDYVEPV